MAGIGPPPKENRSRPRDNFLRESATSKLTATGDIHGPDLPGEDWPAQTLAWWDTLRRSPMAQTWIDADWATLLDTALLHRELWTGNLSVASELRQRMGQFGTSPESRLRLRIAVDTEAEKVKAADPTPKSDRRRRLLKAVGDGS